MTVRLSYSDGATTVAIDCDGTPASHCEAMAACVAFANAVYDLEQRLGGKGVRVTVTGPTSVEIRR